MNKRMIFKEAHAKINLCLDVLGRRSDGYHLVDMVMQQIDLHDDVIIEAGDVPESITDRCCSASCECAADEHAAADTGSENDRKPSAGTIICGRISLVVEDLRHEASDIPTDRNNLMYRAAELMMDKYDIHSHISMKLIKRIPSEAGLGGGSADAAAVLTGINELFGLEIPEDELMRLGAGLGSDIPFCIMGGTARAEGTGTDMTRLPSLAGISGDSEHTVTAGRCEACAEVSGVSSFTGSRSIPAGSAESCLRDDIGLPDCVLLIKPRMSGSTPKIYAAYDRAASEYGEKIKHPDTAALSRAIDSCCPQDIRQVLIDNNLNVLEYAVIPDAPVLTDSDISDNKANAVGSACSFAGAAADERRNTHETDLISAIKNRLLKLGAVTASMTGSGSVVYGLFDSEAEMLCAKEHIADETLTAYISAVYATRFYG